MEALLGFVAALVLVWTARRLTSRRKYLAACEYWIYLPEEQMPAPDAVMSQLLQAFWGERGTKLPALPITAAEGRLLSDVRLHMGLVLRSKNPHVFRPDLFGDTIEPTPALLESLARSKALAKVRFLSDIPLADRLQLCLVPAMAGTVAHLGGATAVFDVVSEHLQPVETLETALADREQLDTAEWNARVVWRPASEGGRAETRGLVKIGLPEIASLDAPSDHQVLVRNVLEAVVREVWQKGAIPDELTVSNYGDEFRVLFTPDPKGPTRARIQRIQTV